MDKMYAGVLFDIDDTLYLVSDLLQEQWSRYENELTAEGVDIDALIESYLNLQGTLPYKLLLRAALDDSGNSQECYSLLREISNRRVPETLTPCEGVVELLTHLKSTGIKVGVLTNGEKDRQEDKVKALGLSNLIDVVLVGDGENVPFKPEHSSFRLAAALMGLATSELMMVGDRIDNDILPAHQLGMGTVHLQQGNHSSQGHCEQALLSTVKLHEAWSMVVKSTAQVETVIPSQRRDERVTQEA